MKKIILSAMMMMAMMCFTGSVSAQDNGDKKAKKECCEKKQDKGCCEKKQDKGCCEKKDGAKAGMPEAKKKDCKKCTECKAECGDNGCKECPNNHKCEKNCKK